MLYILCDVCDNSQTTEYMKQVNTSLILILIAINATANEFQ